MKRCMSWTLVVVASVLTRVVHSAELGPLAKIVVPRAAEAAGGTDLVALLSTDQVVLGRREFSSVLDAQNYYFANESAKRRFDENPLAYRPVLSGYSVVPYKSDGSLVAGNVAYRSTYGGRLYLFADSEQKKSFDADPAAYEDVDLLLDGVSPVSLIEDNIVRRGDRDFEVVFEGRRVRLASSDEKNEFLADPQRYFPSLAGIDPISVADGKPVFGSPKYCAVYKGRLHCMSNPENRDRFLANPTPHSDLDVVDGGRDPVALVERRTESPGHYAISAYFRGQRFLFASEANRKAFLEDPVRYDRERKLVRVKSP